MLWKLITDVFPAKLIVSRSNSGKLLIDGEKVRVSSALYHFDIYINFILYINKIYIYMLIIIGIILERTYHTNRHSYLAGNSNLGQQEPQQ